jgi:hypothetical protein
MVPVIPDTVIVEGYGEATPDVPVAGIAIVPELPKVDVAAKAGAAMIERAITHTMSSDNGRLFDIRVAFWTRTGNESCV